MKKILVTGGAGYIGSHTVVELVNSGYQPIIIDDFRNSEQFILDRIQQITNQEIICYHLDCNQEKNLVKVFEEHEIKGVIHFAAYKAVGESVDQPLAYYENNVGSLVTLLKVMERFDCRNLVFSSSCTVYGEPESGIVTENSPVVKAKSPYGQTKVICENIITDYFNSDSSSVSSIILRYFNPIGAHESSLIGELPIGHPNNLVPFITQSAIGKRGNLTIFGKDYNTPDGTCIRDYIHVVDLAIAHIKALDLLFENNKMLEILNVGTGEGISVLDLVKKFEDINEIKVSWEYGNRREGDVEKVFADATKVKKSLNWSCKYSTEDALKHAWNWEKKLQK